MNPHIPHHKIVMVAHTPTISECEESITVLCLLCLCIAIQMKHCSKSASVITVAMHCRLGKLRVVFRWFYFLGHTYFFVVPTMSDYCGSWYTYENTLIEHKRLWFNWCKGVRIMEDPLFTCYYTWTWYLIVPGPMKLFKCAFIIHSCLLSNINYLHLAYEVQDESRCLSRNCMLIK